MVISNTAEYVKDKMYGESSGHDWWHIYRVVNNAKQILKFEQADEFIVEISALLHDIADYKLHDGDDSLSDKVVTAWLESQDVDLTTISKVCTIINELSFKGAKVSSSMSSIEGMIVQDADRLDALGAVGVARAFSFGGHFNQQMHNPGKEVVMHESFDEYKKKETTTINHFYEKLLLLRDLINTKSAKMIADKRHAYMLEFLDVFHKEWAGVDLDLHIKM